MITWYVCSTYIIYGFVLAKQPKDISLANSITICLLSAVLWPVYLLINIISLLETKTRRSPLMPDFAKMFQSEKYGQLVAIKKSQDETGIPEVRLFMQPPGLGVCAIALGFKDSDEGWDLCDSAFDKIDLELAEGMAKEVFDKAPIPVEEPL